MRNFLIIVVGALVCTVVGVGFGLVADKVIPPASSNSLATTGALIAPSQTQETYKPLDLKGRILIFKTVATRIDFENGGKPIRGDPRVTDFIFSGHNIELVTNNLALENGDFFANTKAYGKIKVVYAGGFGTTLWVTPSQQAALLKLPDWTAGIRH
jgi:hypothetical protein